MSRPANEGEAVARLCGCSKTQEALQDAYIPLRSLQKAKQEPRGLRACEQRALLGEPKWEPKGAAGSVQGVVQTLPKHSDSTQTVCKLAPELLRLRPAAPMSWSGAPPRLLLSRGGADTAVRRLPARWLAYKSTDPARPLRTHSKSLQTVRAAPRRLGSARFRWWREAERSDSR